MDGYSAKKAYSMFQVLTIRAEKVALLRFNRNRYGADSVYVLKGWTMVAVGDISMNVAGNF